MEVLTISLSLLCAVLGAIIGILTYQQKKTAGDKTSGQQFGVMQSDLGYIKKSIDTLDTKLDNQNKIMREFAERLSAVEASARQAHKRIDRIDGMTEH